MAKQRLLAATPKIENLIKQLLRSPAKKSLAADEFYRHSSQSTHASISADVGTKIKVRNTSTTAIGRFTAVSILGATSVSAEDLEMRISGVAVANGEPAVSGQGIWGISCEDIPAGEYGEVILTGITPAYFSGDGVFVEPSPNGLVAIQAGHAAVVLPASGDFPGIINLGSNSASSPGHQFTVVDSSSTNSDGSVELKISVIDGNGNDQYCGSLNGFLYSNVEIPLQGGIGHFFVYAVDGNIYALSHTFASDLLPVLLLAEIDVKNGTIFITQKNFADNPIVAVVPSIWGKSTMTGTVSYNRHVLTASYSIESIALCNYNKITLPKTTIPLTAEETGSLIVYADKLVVENDVTPVTGFEFSTGEPSREWFLPILQYKLSPTEFRVFSQLENPYLLTFTKLYLNASEG